MVAKFVLDTHALVWMLVAPEKLGRGARAVAESVESGRAEALVPDAVLEEVMMLRERGRSSVGISVVRQACRIHPGLVFLPSSIEQLEEFERLGAILDPFDRRIVAAARSCGGKLVTRDRLLSSSRLVATVWN